MRWYQGDIEGAISLSKRKGAIFLVYIEGKDDKSVALTGLLDDSAVCKEMEKDHFVGIKIEANSVSHTQFKHIYSKATAPSIYFIGKGGATLEIVTEPSNSKDFLNKITEILKKGDIVPQSTNVPVKQQASETFIKQESQQSLEQKIEAQSASGSSEIPSTSEPSQEEKLNRAKQLLEETKLKKQAEEAEKERQKEMERRKAGQNVQKLKEWQREQEMKHVLDDHNKEKKEKEEARQRVLAQIAQDKAERAAKFAAQEKSTTPPPVQRPATTGDSGNALLQMRLPNGGSHTHSFPSTSTLQDVRNYITTNINPPFHNFTLSTTFPRRQFGPEDNKQTLSELELIPNAVLLILPGQQGAVIAQGGSLINLFWTIFSPLFSLFGFLKRKVFGTGRSTGLGSPSSSQRKRSGDNSATESSSAAKKRLGDSTVVRRQGNIHRLTDRTDSDEDNNTWNGNSTQQM